ncbi:hypothetical protein OBBRIDRAFT_798526 [Obba rivulosa]|uniref:RNA polymerase II elongation factor ELL N-terminal domain-containing protein n=1 Tax=Obba rivulosa TaxID=1052685 RepID=A0A8E2DEQ2_9APHY|nr:hypothetical protein OBBRIDRAFT_798526 [Obba rivulosa]
MPLPGPATFPLHPPPQPGDPTPTIPKAAFLVRVPEEMLLALQEFPKNIELDFGEPGYQRSTLYIGDTALPMKAEEEKKTHELYMRSLDPRKAPSLKYYGSIHGKFIVERELDEKVEDRVRHRTQVAEKERTERKTIALNAPPPGVASSKPKKKKAPMFINKPAPVVEPRRDPPTTSHASTSRTALSRPSDLVPSTVRYRLVHYIGVESRTEAAILRRLIGNCPDEDTRAAKERELLRLLPKVAEKVPDNPQVYRLKTQAWLEVKPWEFPKLHLADRQKMTSALRSALKAAQIPKSDERWQRLDPPPGWIDDSPQKLPLKTSTELTAKRPIMSDGKQKKAKALQLARERDAETIIAKNEGSRTKPDASGKGKQREDGSSDTAVRDTAKSVARKPPGSGFRVNSAGSSATPPATEPPPKRTGPVDAREAKRQPPAPSGPARPAPSIPPPTVEQDRKPSPSPYASNLPKERIQKKPKTSPVQTGAPDTGRERARDATPSALKRKKPHDDGSDFSERDLLSPGLPKRPKTHGEPVARERHQDSDREKESDRERRKHRDLDVPPRSIQRERSPLGPNRVRVKKESPPPPVHTPSTLAHPSLPPRPSGQVPERPHIPSTSSSASTPRSEQQRAGSSKFRRPSPKYTSSEDEGETPPKKEQDLRSRARVAHLPSFVRRAALPRERPALKRYYREVFVVYSALFSEHAVRCARAAEVLEDFDFDAASEGGMDIEEAEELAPEVVAAFMELTDSVFAELMRIRSAWMKLGGVVDGSSGELVD